MLHLNYLFHLCARPHWLVCYKCYQGQINAIYLFSFFKSHTHLSSICLILSPYFLSVLLSLFTTSSQRCERTFLSSISWSMNDKCRWIAASYSCRWIASLCFASFSISFACRSVNSRCWFCTGEKTEYGEKDVFFSWKKKSQFFQQESNLWPSGYQSRCSTTKLQETPAWELRPLN